MTLAGLDLNATRVLAVAGRAGDLPRPAELDPPLLGLALALTGEPPQVGAAALRVCRRAPLRVQMDFLPGLNRPPGRCGGDPTEAVAVVLRQAAAVLDTSGGAVSAVPAYLDADQVAVLFALAEDSGLPLSGTVSAPLALALAAREIREWPGTAVIIDADEHALTVSAVAAAPGEVQLLETRSVVRLGLRAWTERLLDGLADRSILQSRRDPRDCPAAEQALFDQLGEVMEACRHGRPAHIAFQTAQWYQQLTLAPEEIEALCAVLTRQTLAEVQEVFAAPWPAGPPSGVFASDAAARLPGLVPAVQAALEAWRAALVEGAPAPLPPEDFGEGLLDMESGSGVEALPADAAARAAHALAELFARGDLPSGHLDVSAPLPVPPPVHSGPPRLRYQGRDYLFDGPAFTLGWQAGCDLVFACDSYPTVSPLHCLIRGDATGYTLHDRSRTGTLVNDCPIRRPVPLRPGDTIRLGAGGPELRFLGRPATRPLTRLA
jgi:hypothetical protein